MCVGVVSDQPVAINLYRIYSSDTFRDRIDRVEMLHYRMLMRHRDRESAKIKLDLAGFSLHHSAHERVKIFDH